MPLYKRKPFLLLEPPQDLEPLEPVFQVRFTKEIFRDYKEYLYRIDLYRRRLWTCKVTGKSNLTYEEALVSEKHGSEKFQLFPPQLIKPMLHVIQYRGMLLASHGECDPLHSLVVVNYGNFEQGWFSMSSNKVLWMLHLGVYLHKSASVWNTSYVLVKGRIGFCLDVWLGEEPRMLSLKNLADAIYAKLQDSWFEGFETYASKENSVFPCRIERILDDGAGSMRYEIVWLGKEKEVVGNAVVTGKDIISKKFPYSRNVLKSFIRESTWRNAPWVINDKLAEKHGISRDLPEELKSKFVFYNGKLVGMKKKRNMCREESESMERGPGGRHKRMKVDGSQSEGQDGETRAQCIKYPIEDLLVQPGPDDPVFTDRPAPSRDFKVPMNCVADLLMVWDFCSSFSRLINLYPFSMEDFENSICHKDGNLVLLVESHSALLHLLIRNGGEYFSALQRKKCNFKITLITWAEYLSDFLDMTNRQDLSTHVATIKRGHYGLLSVDTKLDIFRELVDYALQTDIIRDQLDEYIDQWHELGATRRGEALEEGKKRREAKQGLKTNSDGNINIAVIDNGLDGAIDNNHSKMNGELVLEKSSSFLKKRNCDALGISKEKMKKQEGDDVNKHENAPGGTGKNVEINESSIELRKNHYEREMEKRFIRTNPLGKDRDHNRYWWFRRDGRIFVESSDSKTLGYYNTKKELDALMGSLNSKGERERTLQKQLEKFYSRICLELEKRSEDTSEKVAFEESVLRRSTRVRAPPRESPTTAYLRYINRWKEDQ